jgi:FimV-like protein
MLSDVGEVNVEDVRIGLASQAEFARFGIDQERLPSDLEFTLRADASGSRVQISTDTPVEVTQLELVVEVIWPEGRLLREYLLSVEPLSALDKMRDGDQPLESEPRLFGGPDNPGARQAYLSDVGPRPGGRYLVTGMDTLWRIATEGRPAGASIEQFMIETLRFNPAAFSDSNINGLKAGYILKLPRLEDIEISVSASFLAVAQQNQVWMRRGREDREEGAKPVKAPTPGYRPDWATEGDVSVEEGVTRRGSLSPRNLDDVPADYESQRGGLASELGPLIEKVTLIESSLRQIKVRLSEQERILGILADEFERQRLAPKQVFRNPGLTEMNTALSGSGGLLAAGLAGLNLGVLAMFLFTRRVRKAEDGASLDKSVEHSSGPQVDPPGSIYGAETDPVDSKLDLARAYLDMRHANGARPVLMEVIAEGSSVQQAEARELLGRLEAD